MSTICLVPARGGSQGIPRKNVREICGRPLIAWVLESALESKVFDEVWVSTDDDEIENVAFASGARVHRRDPATATSEASTESAVFDFLKMHEPKYVCIVQATSPLTTAEHFRAAYKLMRSDDCDSLVTVTRQHIFLWSAEGKPLNYDPANRPRRQEWPGELVENGAFYFTRAATLKETGHRLGGKCQIYEMPRHCSLDLDEPSDLITCEALMSRYRMAVAHQ